GEGGGGGVAVRLLMISVGAVAPLMLVYVVPLSVLTCHCTVGAGVPLAAAVKITELPTEDDWFVGWVVTTGAVLTVRDAGLLMALGATVLLKTASYRLPLCAAVGVKVRVAAVAPGTLLKVAPPSLLTCHCPVGAGVPLAAAVNVTALPAVTVWLVGWVVTSGALPAALTTVSVAALLVALPAAFVKTAW